MHFADLCRREFGQNVNLQYYISVTFGFYNKASRDNAYFFTW